MFMAADTYGSEDNFKINFEEFDNVSFAFSALFSIFQKVIDDLTNNEFKIIRNACCANADEQLCSLLRNAGNSFSLFRILAMNTKYCNWIDIRFLEVIAHANRNMQLVNLVKNYKKTIFSRSLREVWNYLPLNSKNYTELKAIFDNKDLEKVTVKEFIETMGYEMK